MNRFTRGDQISLGGAVLLFIALFLPWYGIEDSVFGDGPGSDVARALTNNVSANAFEAFDIIDIVLLLLSIAAAAILVLVNMEKIDAGLKRFVESIGAFAAIAVLFRIIVQPDLASPKWGIFVALIAAVAIAAGQYLARTNKV